eukprot:TRINITY_DN121420_c0_g1_i1.p1 TRINITY_DN121420_c0_g1~~TRINITY_DN121420_c0_g1_i1.p1  ORF type:complete len:268 (-),score=41.93 TRINITY_DN121420_c0_g1_i1:173-976(-)
MVIPMGDGGDGGAFAAPMLGPPPAQLAPRFKIIKLSLILQILGLIVLLASQIALMPNNTAGIVFSSLNALLIIVVGIFLLEHDPMFKGAYECLVRTFCYSCAAQCQGGMSCLCTWWFINLLNFILALLPGGALWEIVAGIQVLANMQTVQEGKFAFPVKSTPWLVLWSMIVAAEAVILVAQFLGGWQGFKGFQEYAALRSGQEGMYDMTGGGGGGGADSGWGGGGGGQARDWGAPAGRMQEPTQGQPQAGRGPGFQAFQGTGQRLGA